MRRGKSAWVSLMFFISVATASAAFALVFAVGLLMRTTPALSFAAFASWDNLDRASIISNLAKYFPHSQLADSKTQVSQDILGTVFVRIRSPEACVADKCITILFSQHKIVELVTLAGPDIGIIWEFAGPGNRVPVILATPCGTVNVHVGADAPGPNILCNANK